MAKQLRRKRLVITVFLLMLLSYSAYASPMPTAQAAEATVQEKGIEILNKVVGLNLTKYAINTKEYSMSPYFGVLPQENVDYYLESNGSKVKVFCTFIEGALSILYVSEWEGSPHMTKTAASVLEKAKNFLSNYQNYSGNSFYGELAAMLDEVDASKDVTAAFGNVKLEVTNSGGYKIFKWSYTLNGVNAACKCVALGYKNGFLEYFIDKWDLYKIGSTDINLSEEKAIAIAMEAAKAHSWKVVSGNDTVEINDFNVTKAIVKRLGFCSSFNADNPRGEDLLTLYPMWRIGVGLDKFYPGNVYGIYVDVWADTKEIRYIREVFSTLPPEMLEPLLFGESTGEASDGQASPEGEQPSSDESTAKPSDSPAPAGEAQPNPIPVTWIAVAALAAVVLGTAPVGLHRKKKST